MIELTLPWPAKELSPNARVHWTRVAKAKKAYLTACYNLALEERQFVWRLPDGPLKLELEFSKPSRRKMDQDNLIARMKSGIDGVCKALRIDDSRFKTIVASFEPEWAQPKGLVHLIITEGNTHEHCNTIGPPGERS
jgi:crossover junction endodeoxyribonuclease RusA